MIKRVTNIVFMKKNHLRYFVYKFKFSCLEGTYCVALFATVETKAFYRIFNQRLCPYSQPKPVVVVRSRYARAC